MKESPRSLSTNMTIEEHYQDLCLKPSDIYQHLPTLKRYATGCDFVVELGVRGIVSTWALLAGKPKQMISVDIEDPKTFGGDVWEVYDATNAEGIAWEFVKKSSLEIDLPEHDFLFIDTIHEKDFLAKELERHHLKVKKFIAMHDTNLAGDTGMREAINEFLDAHSEWEIAENFDNCNGMCFLKRV